MIFKPVDALPKKATARSKSHDLISLLNDFMERDVDIVEVDISDDDYMSPYFCENSLRQAVTKYRYPVRVSVRQNTVYLIKESTRRNHN